LGKLRSEVCRASVFCLPWPGARGFQSTVSTARLRSGVHFAGKTPDLRTGKIVQFALDFGV